MALRWKWKLKFYKQKLSENFVTHISFLSLQFHSTLLFVHIAVSIIKACHLNDIKSLFSPISWRMTVEYQLLCKTVLKYLAALSTVLTRAAIVCNMLVIPLFKHRPAETWTDRGLKTDHNTLLAQNFSLWPSNPYPEQFDVSLF